MSLFASGYLNMILLSKNGYALFRTVLTFTTTRGRYNQMLQTDHIARMIHDLSLSSACKTYSKYTKMLGNQVTASIFLVGYFLFYLINLTE